MASLAEILGALAAEGAQALSDSASEVRPRRTRPRPNPQRRRRQRHARQRRELRQLATETIPQLERRQSRLASTGLDLLSDRDPFSLGGSDALRRQQRLSEVEERLDKALEERYRLASAIRKRRGSRAEPVTAVEVAMALAGALPPVRGAQLLGLGAKAALGAGAKAAPKLAAKEIAEEAVERTAARAAAKGAVRGTAKSTAKRAARRSRPDPADAAKLPKPRPVRRTLGTAPILGAGGSDSEISNLARAPVELARASIEDPGGVGKATLGSLKDTLLGIPAAAVETGRAGFEALPFTPGDTERLENLGEMIGSDYSERYGPLLRGDTDEFRRRLTEGYDIEVDGEKIPVEGGGLTPFAFDALVAAPPASRVAGSLARSGSLGPRAQRFMTEGRPGLRTAANDVIDQDLSRGVIGAMAQRGLDARRRRAGERREARGERRLVEAEAGEVVPIRAGKRLEKSVAEAKGRAFIQMTEEQAQQITRGARKEIAGLSRKERLGLTHALRFGIRDPETARAVLGLRLKQIAENRAAVGEMGRYNQAKAIQRLIEDADEVFTPKLAAVANGLRRKEKRLAVGDPLQGEKRLRDPSLNSEQALRRRYAQQAELVGVEKADGESGAEFAARVRAEAKRQGLADPSYVASEIPRGQRFSEFAVGGMRASHRNKRYKGSLYRTGRESDDPEIVVRGLARNVKRRYNWSLVADTFERHTPKWGRNKSMPDLVRELQNRGIDESEVAFWNPAIYRQEVEKAVRSDSDEAPGSTDLLDDRSLGRALVRATGEGVDPAEFAGTKGWSIVPRKVMDQLESQVRASGGMLGRTTDILTGKSARYLLALNPPWLGFQVVSNAALAALGKAGPVSMVKGSLWWKKLPDEQKRAIGPYIGIGHFASDVRQTKLGSATRSLWAPVRSFVDAYRAFKESKFGRAGAKVNPLDTLFRVDNAQNNFFRRAIFYKQMNRELYRSMGKNVSAAMKAQQRLTNILRLDPDDQLKALARDPKVLERNARAVSDFLGDYTTYTARERALLKRNIMFYGYLRFSLRFAFYTMPVKHPVMTGLIGNLARLKTEEIKKLIGSDLPFAIGQFYFDEGKMVVDLSRANPALNALTEAAGPRSALGVLPPYWGMFVSQVTNTDPFTGKEWQTEGLPAPREVTDYGVEERARIALDQGLSLFWGYRTLEEIENEGAKVGADSLAFDPRPIEYAAGGEADVSNRERIRKAKRRSLGEILTQEALTAQPAENVTAAARFLEEMRREEERAREGQSSGGGSSGWGGGGW